MLARATRRTDSCGAASLFLFCIVRDTAFGKRG
jgi:hypothetical protein